jgi:hypothetical protein
MTLGTVVAFYFLGVFIIGIASIWFWQEVDESVSEHDIDPEGKDEELAGFLAATTILWPLAIPVMGILFIFYLIYEGMWVLVTTMRKSLKNEIQEETDRD